MSIWIVRLRAHLLLAVLGVSDRFHQWAIGLAERDVHRLQENMRGCR